MCSSALKNLSLYSESIMAHTAHACQSFIFSALYSHSGVTGVAFFRERVTKLCLHDGLWVERFCTVDDVGKDFVGTWARGKPPALPPAGCGLVLPGRGAVSRITEGPGSKVHNNQPGSISWRSILYGGAAGMLGTNLSGEEDCVQNVSESATDQ